MRSAAECLGMAENMDAKALGCEKAGESAGFARLADGWRKIAKLADQQDRWGVTPVPPFNIL